MVQCSTFHIRLLLGQRLYVTVDPGVAKQVLQNAAQHDKPPLLKIAMQVTAGRPNIVMLRTATREWQTRRKNLARTFASWRLKHKVPALLPQKLEEMWSMLQDHAREGTPVELDPLITCCLLDFFAKEDLKYDLHTLSGDSNSEGRKFMHESEVCKDEFYQKCLLNPFRPYYFWNAKVTRAWQGAAWLKAFALRIIENYRSKHADEDDDSIIATLMRSNLYADDMDLVAEILILLIASSDSSAITITWCLYDLVRTPAVKNEVQRELDVLYSGGGHPTFSELSELAVLKRCVKESMRLWPVAAADLFRVMGSPITTSTGHVIPEGVLVVIPFYAMFRSCEIADPDSYQPDRWINPSAALEGSFIPFSTGPRDCVAQNLGHIFVYIVLAELLHRFDFEMLSPPHAMSKPLLSPVGLRFRATCREGVF